MPHLMTREMLGHTIDSVTGAYFKSDPQAVKEEYIKVLDQLTTKKIEIKLINTYDSINEELEQKEQKIRSLEATIDNLTGRVVDMEETVYVSDEDLIWAFEKSEKLFNESNSDNFDDVSKEIWEELKKRSKD